MDIRHWDKKRGFNYIGNNKTDSAHKYQIGNSHRMYYVMIIPSSTFVLNYIASHQCNLMYDKNFNINWWY